nr:MAG TPA: hypothetical protein [Herelleviridae sp.]DAQ37410.1 MAG TPA: hypothetical protein [Caudoviricetes sp.]
MYFSHLLFLCIPAIYKFYVIDFMDEDFALGSN